MSNIYAYVSCSISDGFGSEEGFMELKEIQKHI
jgi:hypothetical protein